MYLAQRKKDEAIKRRRDRDLAKLDKGDDPQGFWKGKERRRPGRDGQNSAQDLRNARKESVVRSARVAASMSANPVIRGAAI